VGVPPEVNNKDILPFFEYYGTVRTFYDVVKPVFFGGRTNQVKNGNRVFILKFFKIIPLCTKSAWDDVLYITGQYPQIQSQNNNNQNNNNRDNRNNRQRKHAITNGTMSTKTPKKSTTPTQAPSAPSTATTEHTTTDPMSSTIDNTNNSNNNTITEDTQEGTKQQPPAQGDSGQKQILAQNKLSPGNDPCPQKKQVFG